MRVTLSSLTSYGSAIPENLCLSQENSFKVWNVFTQDVDSWRHGNFVDPRKHWCTPSKVQVDLALSKYAQSEFPPNFHKAGLPLWSEIWLIQKNFTWCFCFGLGGRHLYMHPRIWCSLGGWSFSWNLHVLQSTAASSLCWQLWPVAPLWWHLPRLSSFPVQCKSSMLIQASWFMEPNAPIR